MSDFYDQLSNEEVRKYAISRGKPSWLDFSINTIRDLLRDDDKDREDIESYKGDY